MNPYPMKGHLNIRTSGELLSPISRRHIEILKTVGYHDHLHFEGTYKERNLKKVMFTCLLEEHLYKRICGEL